MGVKQMGKLIRDQLILNVALQPCKKCVTLGGTIPAAVAGLSAKIKRVVCHCLAPLPEIQKTSGSVANAWKAVQVGVHSAVSHRQARLVRSYIEKAPWPLLRRRCEAAGIAGAGVTGGAVGAAGTIWERVADSCWTCC